MAITTASSAKLTAAGTTQQDYFTALYTWFVSNPGNFTVENAAGGPVSSFTLTHSQGWQINLRVSAGTVLGMIAPEGGITNSATPGTPLNFSGEAAFLPSISGTSVNCNVIRYSDAITFCLKPAAETHWTYGFHAGKIFTPENQNDPTDYFIDGLGVLGNIPNLSSGAVGNTWSSSTPSGYVSRIRVSQSVWYPCMFENITNITGVSAQGPRPSPYTVVAAGVSMSSFSPNFGRTKYLRRHNANIAPFTVVPGVSTTQGWMAYNHLSSNSGSLILWDRTVLP